MNFSSWSHEPQSASIANFTLRDVVSGPGVSRYGMSSWPSGPLTLRLTGLIITTIGNPASLKWPSHMRVRHLISQIASCYVLYWFFRYELADELCPIESLSRR